MLEVTAAEIASYRRGRAHLDQRLGAGSDALRAAAHAGLQDSMPRAAVLSLHARVDGVAPQVLDDPALVQVWGPGFSAYVVAAEDTAIFTLGRYPDTGKRRTTADALTARLRDVLDEQPRQYRDVGHDLGVDPNQLRYAALTGTIRLHWAGSGKPLISRLPDPDIDPIDARQELARRFLRVFGPATAAEFAKWAGVAVAHGRSAFDGIAAETTEVSTPIGMAHLLQADEAALRAGSPNPGATRLLPSGDTFTLWVGDQRALLVSDPDLRDRLWTPRVWPGALLHRGEIVGTWRRSSDQMTIETWRPPDPTTIDAIETEVASLPLDEQPLHIAWSTME